MPSNDPAVASILPAPLRSTLTNSTVLATLWSSYGHIYRLTLSGPPHSLILKQISPPAVSLSSSTPSESHLRKLISYRVERYFYNHLSPLLSDHDAVKVARPYPVEAEFQGEALLMEDLSTEYPRSTSAYSFDQAMVAMKWLAGFHAAFWGLDIPELATTVEAPLKVENPDETKGVWRQGGYWYLDTRREELESMVDSQEYEWLSPAVAETVQDLLRREDVPGRTLIHGDMKAANIVFSETWKECAMYDFQYVGKGLGVQDIVKLLGTSVGRQIMRDDGLVERLLTGYHEELARRLEAMGKDLGGYTREVMEKQLEVAMVDWYRFQAGWGFWGNGWVSEKKVRATVARLEKQGDWNF